MLLYKNRSSRRLLFRRKELLGAAAACALMLVSATAAVAAGNPDRSPLAFKQVQSVTAHTDLTASRVSGAGCRGVQGQVYEENFLGWKMWGYFERIDWCWSGTSIKSVSRQIWGTTYYPGWSYDEKFSNSSQSGGTGFWTYRSRTQGHFCMVAFFGCVTNRYPWVDITVRGDGNAWWSSGY